MKSITLVTAGLLGAASFSFGADEPEVKVGVRAPVALQATINEDAKAAARFTNQEILTAMNADGLLDGSIKGWSLSRFTDDADAGDIYAFKPGKPAISIPDDLLTQPAVKGRANKAVATTGGGSGGSGGSGSTTSNVVNSFTYGAISVNNGGGTFSGTESKKTTGVKIANTPYPIIVRSETYSLIGTIGYVAPVAAKPANAGPTNAENDDVAAVPAVVEVLGKTTYTGTYKTANGVGLRLETYFPDTNATPAAPGAKNADASPAPSTP
ncbi:hypothetical protein KBB96_03960 [Luteolibacter ambystomatis]|uniref:Uncharacterized protein n=1 Tax=Luteolibacter ambystomatis TaxID=2824561 RepID=A0A975J108_9BACT|nr:hypothetical protein [Luteolibacter ambystomatis]QUE52048.1 hypothetical protein KBB96_03960 [Luteolibacter ambystomatis]